ncbi:alpha-1,4-glucan--maltose-1-phosphate maltosyltransferase [Paractinoplanes durhamensis]|uniref:Alpha-1,4-glucan:maltose-1-phosphate maltosyltransferase n=1 Tax=Paractinoplanes durhamensis TaxID=113563 RepID=A0ABQ3YWJ0_9ACTN|nr:alpha-1,4-glucan--maltose-1-phosphate maltosyltransferase [Actinoplanes durhamensis]GIE01933.1 alpha-1,4-glucan:maltose-1-phosphate maltosyltransferase [Actinoplanes durhamensis]
MSALAKARRIGRIPVVDVAPVVDGGNRPAKSVVGEEFEVTATVFREGHDAVNATVVLVDPAGHERSLSMTRVNAGLDAWAVTVSGDSAGRWAFRVEGWSDPYGTWNHDAVIKIGAGVDVELMLEEGARVLDRAVAEVERTNGQARVLQAAAAMLRDAESSPEVRLNAGLSSAVVRELRERPLREHVSAGANLPWLVERERALYGAWYEFFPRSEGAHFDESAGGWVSGTFATAAKRLAAVAGMGFDVIYLTPIHPIGRVNRKGPNNSLNGDEQDPGSPYAVGSSDGGHDALHPDLGSFDDFDLFVGEAGRLGLEVALDLAFHCAPDHPWIEQHPKWFTTRADGSIAYAENPPKKYQDIYPLNFDNDPEGLYAELRRVVQVWIDHGVRIFRVDNPHTKPVEFWEWLIADVAVSHPEVIWLAEAFTRPPMMRTLAQAGFQQSYTYYAWRHTKTEIEEYLRELSGPAAAYMRPSFWPTTHDILTPFMQRSGPAGWVLRAALAATLVPTYGIYTGYELVENVARPGAEEQIDNEKYQYKDRQWATHGEQTLAPFLRRLNEIRRAHPALHWLRNLRFHRADDENVLVFSKSRRVYDRDDVILVVANLEPAVTRETTIHLTMPELGLAPSDTFVAHDLITGQHWNWGEHAFVRLGAATEPVHIIHVTPY